MLVETEVFRCAQNCIIVRDGSRTESGNEFHSDEPETEKLCISVCLWITRIKKTVFLK